MTKLLVGALVLGLCNGCGQGGRRLPVGGLPDTEFPVQELPSYTGDLGPALEGLGEAGAPSDDPEMTGALNEAMNNARQWESAWKNLFTLGSLAQADALEKSIQAARAEAARVAERLAAFEQFKALADLFRRLADTGEVYRYKRKGTSWTLYTRSLRKGVELKGKGTWVFSGIAFRTYRRPVPGCSWQLYACPTRATGGKSIPVRASPVSADAYCTGRGPEESLGYFCAGKIAGRAESPLRIYEHRRGKIRYVSGVVAEQNGMPAVWSSLGILGYVP